jgi:hypothetical protein
MSSIKNYSGNLVIKTPVGQALGGSNVTIKSDWVYITGNLAVLGNSTSISTTDTNILDNTIVLNYGETGAGITKGNAGIVIARGTLTNVEIRYNEGIDSWQITNDGTNYKYLLSGNIASGLTTVFEDKTPVLGGNVNTNGFSFNANTNVIFGANLQFNNTLGTPTVINGATIIHASSIGAGQSGLFVVNQANANEELITKRRAVGFSILL